MLKRKDIIENQIVEIDFDSGEQLLYGIIFNIRTSERNLENIKDELQFDMFLFRTHEITENICEESTYCDKYLSVSNSDKMIEELILRLKKL